MSGGRLGIGSFSVPFAIEDSGLVVREATTVPVPHDRIKEPCGPHPKGSSLAVIFVPLLLTLSYANELLLMLRLRRSRVKHHTPM